VIAGVSLPYFAVSDSTACPGAAALRGAADGTLVTAGGGMLGVFGCVRVGGRLGGGPAPGPEGGARLTAPPGSGTEAGGIGGGRSENSCACAVFWTDTTKHAAKANGKTNGKTNCKTNDRPSAGISLPPRRHPTMPLPPGVMPSAFHRKRGKFKPLKSHGLRFYGTRLTPA
jgi:hypothetical protein